MREKLIGLLKESHVMATYEEVADFMIANGVTIPVRCKDCEHRADVTDTGNYLCNRKMLGLVRPDDFCSFGERSIE